LLKNNLLFEKKKTKNIFSFQSMPNLDFAEDLDILRRKILLWI